MLVSQRFIRVSDEGLTDRNVSFSIIKWFVGKSSSVLLLSLFQMKPLRAQSLEVLGLRG